MRYKYRLIIGGIIALALIGGIVVGYDGALKTTLGVIIGYLFGTAPK
ncbi:unnamed protein product [marine sediment metagenome]|uniref:Uncharacterized protein n=1 Tax=marine sediment metagenome TaxID=412755 RepID=X1KMY5_9ZZZZ